MNHHWRFLDTGLNSAYFNMALDEALFLNSHSSGYPVLRFYGWSEPSVSIGYFQDVERSLRMEHLDELNIPVVRRITGGRAVFHDNELTYSIIIPYKSIYYKRKNLELYKELSEGILAGLKNLGIKAGIHKPGNRKDRYQSKANCFTATSAYEITVNGGKIVGSAQRWTDAGVIQQGSILIDLDYENSSRIFKTRDSSCSENISDNNRIMTISKVLGSIPPKDAIIAAIKKGFESALGIDFIDSKLEGKEEGLAGSLMNKKYSSCDWNFLRKKM